MIETSQSITKLATAMRTVQTAVGSVPKDSQNPHFRNRYASLEAVNDAIRDHYLAAGLVVMQAPGSYADGIMDLTTVIVHAESGEWLRTTMQLPVAKTDPQGAGSALTYAERYSLMALFNLPPVDDDGEAASRPHGPAVAPRPRPAPEPAPPKPDAGPISQAAVSSTTRQRLMAAMSKKNTRTELRAWADNQIVASAIVEMTDKDRVFFDAEFKKKWESLPESVAMAG